MDFLSKEHMSQIEKLESLWDLNEMAHEFDINDIFQDNGAKIMQQLIYLNFQNLPGREGNDAIDKNGVEWEMKSINTATSAQGFSTNHHLNHVILSKYRKVPWSFAIYKGIELLDMYVMQPNALEPIFKKWETQLQSKAHINNPKIPIKFVRENGTQISFELSKPKRSMQNNDRIC